MAARPLKAEYISSRASGWIRAESLLYLMLDVGMGTGEGPVIKFIPYNLALRVALSEG
jgi:hypothetical protein